MNNNIPEIEVINGLTSGVIIKNNYKLIKELGRGTFSEIHLVEDNNGKLFAIKFQNKAHDSVSNWECKVLKMLQHTNCSPKIYDEGKVQIKNKSIGYEYLVIELFTGESLDSLRRNLRANFPKFPPVVAVHITRSMLHCLNTMHENGLIHRDVKPANFVRRSPDSTEFCVIDFGISKQFKKPNNELIPPRPRCEFRGTTAYASPYPHLEYEQAPRDDLLSLLHVYIDLTCGLMPWRDRSFISREYGNDEEISQLLKDSRETSSNSNIVLDKAINIKIKLKMYSDIDKYIEWIMENINEDSISADAPQILRELIQYLYNLTYEITPDYEKVDSLLSKLSSDQSNNVRNIDFTFENFHWDSNFNILSNVQKQKQPQTQSLQQQSSTPQQPLPSQQRLETTNREDSISVQNSYYSNEFNHSQYANTEDHNRLQKVNQYDSQRTQMDNVSKTEESKVININSSNISSNNDSNKNKYKIRMSSNNTFNLHSDHMEQNQKLLNKEKVEEVNLRKPISKEPLSDNVLKSQFELLLNSFKKIQNNLIVNNTSTNKTVEEQNKSLNDFKSLFLSFTSKCKSSDIRNIHLIPLIKETMQIIDSILNSNKIESFLFKYDSDIEKYLTNENNFDLPNINEPKYKKYFSDLINLKKYLDNYLTIDIEEEEVVVKKMKY